MAIDVVQKCIEANPIRLGTVTVLEGGKLGMNSDTDFAGDAGNHISETNTYNNYDNLHDDVTYYTA